MKRRFTKYPSSYVRASSTLMEEYARQTITHNMVRYEQGLLTLEDIVSDVVNKYGVSPEYAWSIIDSMR